MKAKGMYIGYRDIDYPERTNAQGVKMPALKGRTLTFFQNRWKKGALTENGKFYNMLVKEGEEMPKLERGEVYDIDITNIDERQCKLYEENEEEFDD